MAVPNPTLELAVVFESADPVAFSIAKSALEEAGIEFAATEDALTGYGFSPMLNPVCKIQVAQDCEAQATEILQGLFAEADTESEAPASEE
jgi:hypothetical protein